MREPISLSSSDQVNNDCHLASVSMIGKKGDSPKNDHLNSILVRLLAGYPAIHHTRMSASLCMHKNEIGYSNIILCYNRGI